MDETLILVLQSCCVLNQTQPVPPTCLPCPMYRPKMIDAIFISDYLVRKVWGHKCLDVLSCKVVVFSTRLNLSPHPSAHNVWDTCEGPISEEPVWKKSSRKSWRECAGCWWPAQLVGRYAQVGNCMTGCPLNPPD